MGVLNSSDDLQMIMKVNLGFVIQIYIIYIINSERAKAIKTAKSGDLDLHVIEIKNVVTITSRWPRL